MAYYATVYNQPIHGLGAYYQTVYNQPIHGLGMSEKTQWIVTAAVAVAGIAALVVGGQALAWMSAPEGTPFWKASGHTANPAGPDEWRKVGPGQYVRAGGWKIERTEGAPRKPGGGWGKRTGRPVVDVWWSVTRDGQRVRTVRRLRHAKSVR